MTTMAQLMPSIPSCGCSWIDERKTGGFRVVVSLPTAISGFRLRKRRGDLVVEGRRRRSNALDVPTTATSTTTSTDFFDENAQIRTGEIEIPVSCYQIIGVSDRAEKDEIVKSVKVLMDLKNVKVEEGYTLDAVDSCKELLTDVRDKLLFEPEYAGNVREKVPPKSSLRLLWSCLPGALCLLQEVGEEKLVLEIGQAALKYSNAKLYIHDISLSMALAECAIAKTEFEKKKVSEGFEALARAQDLLESVSSLRKMSLLSQIQESLEDLVPACTLELLGLPPTPENAERRRGAVAALRELLRQGLDVESSCRVEDWPCFLREALNKLMATEIVDLLQWHNLAVTRKNKKSLESQSQRVIIDFNCFYKGMLAHIALGFSGQQIDLINKAKMLCECLAASEGVDLKFEEALCSFLLGQGAEKEAVERLRELKSSSGPASRSFVPIVSQKEITDGCSMDPSLEIWLKDAVLGLFPDTRGCSPTLANFFKGERKILRATKNSVGIPRTIPSLSRGSPSFVSPPNQAASEETVPGFNSNKHVAAAMNQPANTRNLLTTIKTSSGGTGASSVQLKRKLGTSHNKIWERWTKPGSLVGSITLITVVGCFVFVTFKLFDMQFRQMKSMSRSHLLSPKTGISAVTCNMNPSLDKADPAYIGGNNIRGRVRRILTMFSKKPRNVLDGVIQSSLPDDELLFFTKACHKRQMTTEEAEALVKHWQVIKAEALGPDHQLQSLSEILAEPMLAQWRALADSAKAKSCFWRFVLLQLAIVRADIVCDEIGREMAEIEALLEEAAELVDESQSKNPNYYSTYRIRYVLERQLNGSWRFCKWVGGLHAYDMSSPSKQGKRKSKSKSNDRYHRLVANGGE